MKIRLPKFHCELETDSEAINWWKNGLLRLKLNIIKTYIEHLTMRDIELGDETWDLINQIYQDWDNWILVHDFAHHHAYFLMVYLSKIDRPEWDPLFDKLQYFKDITYKCMVVENAA